jgi:hypothetical protein
MIKIQNTLPTIQSVMQNVRGSLDIQATLVHFEVVLEIRDCVSATAVEM